MPKEVYENYNLTGAHRWEKMSSQKEMQRHFSYNYFTSSQPLYMWQIGTNILILLKQIVFGRHFARLIFDFF